MPYRLQSYLRRYFSPAPRRRWRYASSTRWLTRTTDYIGGLIVGAEKVLADSGKTALAAQVKHLFTTKLGNDRDTVGVVELERSLAIIRADNAQHPQDQPSEVEDVMAIVLEKNQIQLPDSFYDVNKNFRPKLPLKK